MLEKSLLTILALKRALRYCSGKGFIQLEVLYGLGEREMQGRFFVKSITAAGIDIIEKPKEGDTRPFNIEFNFSPNFNVENLIKTEAKLF